MLSTATTVPSKLQHHCAVVKQPIDALHTYAYDINVADRDFPQTGSYIITQWHGTANPLVLMDAAGCVAYVSDGDLLRLCEKFMCKKGEWWSFALKLSALV